MPKITKIDYKKDRNRYWIYVDGYFCTSVRDRTFPALNLSVGQNISCEQIKELESHHWKHAYGESAWNKEKIRLEKVKNLIESLDHRVVVNIVGFGAKSNKFIAGHPEESGKPDLEVRTRNGSVPVLLVEVTGTEKMRGNTYWVRPDKLEYAKNHPKEDVWLILHYQNPTEKFVFIKPNLQKEYRISEIPIRDSIEHYIEFSDSDSEVVSRQMFLDHLNGRVDRI